MSKFTKQISAFVNQVSDALLKDQKKAIRKALNESAKVVEQTIKPQAPLLKSSTNFRQRGTVKNNIRHKTRVRKDGQSGFTVIRVMRTQKRRMARIGENTKDKTDPFYWWMLEYGTKKMEARPFMEKGFKESEPRAIEKAKAVYYEEMKKYKNARK